MERCKISQICEVKGGGTPKTSIPEYWNGDFVWVTPKDLGQLTESEITNSNSKISEEGLHNSSAKLLPVGSLVLSTRAPIGYVAIAQTELATNQGCRSFICDPEKVYNKFLYYFLKTQIREMNRLAGGSTFNEISGSKLKELEIPLLPLSEQKRIAAKLDDLMNHISEAKTLRTQAQNDTNQLLPAALHHIFSQAEQNGWEEKAIEEISTVQSGFGFPKKLQGKKKGEYPFFKVSDMTSVGNSIYLENVNNYVDEEEVQEYGFKTAPVGTVIFPKIGGAIKTNKKRILTEDAIFDNNTMGLVPTEEVDTKYLFYWLQQFDLSEWSSGSSLPAIKKSVVSKTKIPLPSLEEQHRLVQYLDTIAEHTRHLQDHQTQTANDFTELEQSLLHKAFEGEV